MRISDDRNAFVHYKYTPITVAAQDVEKSDRNLLLKALEGVEETVRCLKGIENHAVSRGMTWKGKIL
jgi:hypothetical protein